MNEFGKGGVHDPISKHPQPQTKVDVVELEFEAFVKAVDQLQKTLAGSKDGTRDHGPFAMCEPPVLVSDRGSWLAKPSVCTYIEQAPRHTGVLNCTIGIKQAGPHTANILFH